ncbi:MAG: alpha/beta fold hydrolase [Acidimicrobiales bacterium]|nr:alpha/beta fold hydrolase [Acidimicrobiales bacterium]
MIVTTPDGVDLWFDHEGDGPAVLLIPGRGDPTDLFPAEFSSALLSGGLSVLRWDPRDTGLSGAGGDAYTITTLAEDAVTVLDAAAVETAHVVGISMAGLMLTYLAGHHAPRVRSLTYIAALSPHPEAGMGEDFFGALDVDEPDRADELLRAMGETTDADRAWAVASIAAGDRRAPYRPEAVARHQEAAFRLDWPTMETLRSIQIPTQVFHGRLDRIVPVAHADAIAAGTAGSLTIIDDMGHIPRRRDWLTIADQIVALHAGQP